MYLLGKGRLTNQQAHITLLQAPGYVPPRFRFRYFIFPGQGKATQNGSLGRYHHRLAPSGKIPLERHVIFAAWVHDLPIMPNIPYVPISRHRQSSQKRGFVGIWSTVSKFPYNVRSTVGLNFYIQIDGDYPKEPPNKAGTDESGDAFFFTAPRFI